MIPNPNPAGSDANISQIPKSVMSDRHPDGMGLTSVPQSIIRQKPLPHSITGVTKDVIASLLVFDSTIIISPPIILAIPPYTTKKPSKYPSNLKNSCLFLLFVLFRWNRSHFVTSVPQPSYSPQKRCAIPSNHVLVSSIFSSSGTILLFA